LRDTRQKDFLYYKYKHLSNRQTASRYYHGNIQSNIHKNFKRGGLKSKVFWDFPYIKNPPKFLQMTPFWHFVWEIVKTPATYVALLLGKPLYIILHELAEGSSKCFKFHYLVSQSILLDTYFLFLSKQIFVSICGVLIFMGGSKLMIS
jgi:hypothetical protein